MPKFADTVRMLEENADFLDKFAVVMKTLEQYKEPPTELQDDLLDDLFDAADTKHYNSADKDNYKAQLMNQFEYEATLRDYKEEGRVEGLAEGRAEGLAEGRVEGRAEGLAEGLVKGRDEASVQIARAMKTEGVPDKIILKTTGVDPTML